MAAKKKTTKSGGDMKPRTKTQLYAAIADDTGLAKKEVASVFESLEGIIKKDLGRRGPGIVSLPGLLKVRKVRKPARKARKGINPFTGEEMMFAAKKAHNTVRVTALKKLKDMV